MSKKNRNKFQASNVSSPTGGSVAMAAASPAEYRIIRNDLIRVVVLNVLFLGIVLAVYATNLQSHYLERIYNQLF